MSHSPPSSSPPARSTRMKSQAAQGAARSLRQADAGLRPRRPASTRACTRVIVVVGHGKDEVIAAVRRTTSGSHWVEQTEQLGTGHAARMCEPQLRRTTRRRVHPRRRRAADPRRGAADAAPAPTATSTPPPAWRPRCSTTRPATAGSSATTAGEFVEIVEQARRTPRAARDPRSLPELSTASRSRSCCSPCRS